MNDFKDSNNYRFINFLQNYLNIDYLFLINYLRLSYKLTNKNNMEKIMS